jgi:CubicO group peptidase (beta-lactamase class C family)
MAERLPHAFDREALLAGFSFVPFMLRFATHRLEHPQARGRGMGKCAVLAFCGMTLLAMSPSDVQAARDAITKDDLLADTPSVNGVADNHLFMKSDDATHAKHSFEGTLVLEEVEMGTDPAQFSTAEVLGKNPKMFPAVEIAFFTRSGALVPVSRDVIRYGSTETGSSYWDMIVQPGQVWTEPGDEGWSRASFPFALVHSIEGETHNGIATFLYNENEVSGVRFQIVQQTAPYYITDYFTAWGQAPATYRPGGIANLAGLQHYYDGEVAQRFPMADWEKLESEVGAEALADFESAMKQEEVIVSGLIHNGTFYHKPCKSAAGPLPYCEQTRFGIWSITKAAANTVAILRLAQKYGPEVFDAKIVDYVKSSADHQGWENVKFGDALNMATGVGFGTDKREPNDINDGYLEGNYAAWYEAKSEAEKVAETFKSPDLPWGPGEVARYRDQDMFLLGVALDEYLKSKEGPEAKLWDMLVKEVYNPIGIHYAPTNKTIEAEEGEQPIMAYGYYPTLDDLAKIAQLYQTRGLHNGEQILHAGKLAELMYGPNDRGLPTGEQSRDGEGRYHMAFWHSPYQSADGCKVLLPMMRGWGGNFVVLMPDGHTGIRLAKNWNGEPEVRDITGIATVTDRLAPFCKG